MTIKTGHGVFFRFDTGHTLCVAACEDFVKAKAIHDRMVFFINARETFGLTAEAAVDPDDRKLFEHFERMEKKMGSTRILRSGTGELPLYIKEA